MHLNQFHYVDQQPSIYYWDYWRKCLRKDPFLTRLMEQFDTDDICLLSQDNYYRPKQHQTKDENGIENFDLPGAIDDVAFAADVEKLRSGEVVTREEYTFNNSDKIPNLLHFYPKKYWS